MAVTSVSEWSTTAGSNTELNGISLAENVMVPSAVNNAFREMMAQVSSFGRRGSDLATAGTLNLDSVDNVFLDLTGTITVTAVTLTDTHSRRARAVGAFQITASASLIVNGSTSTNYTTTAGDLLFFEGYGTGVVRVWSASGAIAASNAEVLAGTVTNKYVSPATAYFPTGHLYGLTLSNNVSDATNDIDIAAGTARDGSDTVNMILASALTKRLDASWAVGTGNGGLDTGSIANTTYHVWLIKRSDTGVVDALFSTSATSPTMPSDYDYKRRIGSIIRASAAIRTFVQDGDLFSLVTSTEDISAANPGTSAVTATLASVPTGIRVRAKVVGKVSYATSSALPIFGSISDLSTTDQAPGATTNANVTLLTSTASGNTHPSEVEIMTNTSAQVRYRVSFSDANLTFRINTLGWFDARGRQ